MAGRTYLDLVKAVSKRMRMAEPASVSANSESKLIGELVNQAINTVDNAWRWSHLFGRIGGMTVTAGATTSTFNTSYRVSRVEMLRVFNRTAKTEMEPRPISWLQEQAWIAADSTAQPLKYYAFATYVNDSGDDVFNFQYWPPADVTTQVGFQFRLRQDELSADTDRVQVPEWPVVLKAYSLAIAERGDNGGTTQDSADREYREALQSAISMDAISQGGQFFDWTIT